jgi:cytoskeleton protein RodZ
MDETLVADVPSVGERLRAAREDKGLTLEDIAAQTRIPRRHLESIETSEWTKLPAPTYTMGFAKSYASAVGLDRVEIGDRLREEMGGTRAASTTSEVFEPADPARTMPKWLVFGGIAAVILVVLLMTWLKGRELDEPEAALENNVVAAAPASPAVQAPQPAPATQEPVVLAAIEPVWIQVSEKGGATLFQGTLNPSQNFQVPPTATAPVLKTGKPEALKITVGTAVAPPVGPPAATVSDVSLLPADLMRGPQTAAPAPAPAAAEPAPAPRPRRTTRRPSTGTTTPSAATPPAPPAAETTNTAQ